MYNTDLPTRAELPSAMKLMQSTILAAIVALTLLITIVMPSEYGIDPTGVGRLLGLKQMGEIKTQLAEESATDRQASTGQWGQSTTPANERPVPDNPPRSRKTTIRSSASRQQHVRQKLQLPVLSAISY
jgi:hypothetical protein